MARRIGDNAPVSSTPLPLTDLRARLGARVLTQDEPGFALETAGFNTAVVHAPEVVVAAESTADVAAVVRWARAHRQRIYVQTTGHGAHAGQTGGVFVSTRRIAGVNIDAAARLATIETPTRVRSGRIAPRSGSLSPTSSGMPNTAGAAATRRGAARVGTRWS